MRPPLPAALLATGLALASATAEGRPLLYDGFNSANGPNDLITNEYAFAHPSDPAAVQSPIWEMDSGSFFSRQDLGVTGVPDDCAPGRWSTECTHSALFRLNTKRRDFGDVLVQTSLRNHELTSTPSTPPEAWDGVHLWLRYQSQFHLYYATVNRRDGRLVLKKKCPGGPSNNGTYYTLASRSNFPIRFGSWQLVGAAAHNAASGAVILTVYHDGEPRLRAIDSGTGCAPIRTAGAVGVRGDNDDFALDGYSVSALSGDPGGTNRPPEVTLTSPSPGQAFTGTVQLSATASDDLGVTKLDFLVDGRRVRFDYADPYSVSYTVPSSTAAGDHTVTARAYDTDGATSESSVVVSRP
jgi:hypothetical protein